MIRVKFLLRLSFLLGVLVLVSSTGLYLFNILRMTRDERAFLQTVWDSTYGNDSNYTCSSQLSLGPDFSICKEPQFWPFDETSDGECIVYSFSMSYDLSFERHAASLGCEVFSFDPSESHPMLQVSVGKRLYFRLGIVQEHADRKDRIKLKTLTDIIKRLAHEGMVIDVLKLSITSHIPQVSYEKEILEHILNKGLFRCIRQLILEIHIPSQHGFHASNANNIDIFRLLDELHQNGYKQFQISQLSDSPSIFSKMTKKKPVLYSWKVSYVNEVVLQECKAISTENNVFEL